MHSLPHLEYLPVPRPNDPPISIAKHVAVVLQRCQGHKPLNKQIVQLNEEPILRT